MKVKILNKVEFFQKTYKSAVSLIYIHKSQPKHLRKMSSLITDL